jgi:hypothetical protein
LRPEKSVMEYPFDFVFYGPASPANLGLAAPQ